MAETTSFIRWFSEISIEDVPLVGGKNASLGEMYRELGQQGIRVPNGFAITAEAYRYVLQKNGLDAILHEILDALDPNDVSDLARRAGQIRQLIYAAPLPEMLQDQIIDAYEQLNQQYDHEISVAVRSSATAEDLPTASFAGQQDTFLNIQGRQEVLDACRRCFASLFTDRAIHYRIDQGFDHFQVALSIAVMKMVRSDMAASGVMFSLDTETGFDDVVFITGAYGLGENVVQGSVDPDEFYVHKSTFDQGYRCVLQHQLGSKKIKMVYQKGQTKATTINRVTSDEERKHYCLDDQDILTLADYAIKIEKHYSQKAGYRKAMDIEWAKDGIDGGLYIVQARPETVASQQQGNVLHHYQLNENGPAILEGHAVGGKIAIGPVRIIRDVEQLHLFQPGDVLVADMTTPDWEPVMKNAAAIVTNRGGRTCHAAIIARELGIPAVVGCDQATRKLEGVGTVTVSCAQGQIGKVYEDEKVYSITVTDLKELKRPKTQIMLNLGNPELAFKTRFLPNDGVGLARMEFIVTQSIQAHPMALLHTDQVKDKSERKQIRQLTESYARPEDFFVEKLSEGIAIIAAAFYPKPVVMRMSDFKTNEYASLLGGRWFEGAEANPMIGFRGAFRYTHRAYAEAFALECAAIKRVRDEMGLQNVIVMIPFCRRIQEAEQVLQSMSHNGLIRGENGLKVYMMCEIPNNVILMDAFSRYFDGFSIGSNDLTQLTLGVDRDSEIVAEAFDERDEGVKEMIRMAVEGARRNRKHSGVCGQAPSDYPEMAEYLVKIGIDSMSLNPDTVLETTQRILAIEQSMKK